MNPKKEKVTTPVHPNQDESVFTEGINYFETDADSIWGPEDTATAELLRQEDISGTWLNLAAGDGRYNAILLDKATKVIATDLDKSALSKLEHNASEKTSHKLQTRSFDITRRFPFDDQSLDGIFCTGTLHIFSRPVFSRIVEEMKRVVKFGGKIILDFATDVKRTRLDGKEYIIKEEPKYSSEEARRLLEQVFGEFDMRMIESSVPEQLLDEANPKYKFSCNFLLVVAEKTID